MANQIGVEVVAVGVAAFSRAMRTAQDDTDRLTGSINKAAGITQSFGSNLVSVGGNLQRLGRTMLIDVTAPIGILTGTLINAGIQFQDSFAGVTKTVDGLAVGFNEIKAAAQDKLGITITTMDEARVAADRLGMSFGDLTPTGKAVREEFLKMGLEIPVATADLAKLGEIVGQLGVESPQIAEVTRLVSMLGVATDVAAEDAAFSLIRMANIMGSTVGPNAISMEEFIRRAGSAVVELGNKSVATEGEILNFALRLSAAGEMAGLSEQEVLAWATTLADLGARAESGGTAVSRALDKMIIAVQTGSDDLQVFADVMGMSGEEFTKTFQDDASQALSTFTIKLKEGIETGKVTEKMLTDMGLGGIRAFDIMGRLGNAQDLLTKNLNNANTAWSEAIALENEAEKRFSTFKSQLQVLKNTFTDLGVAIFDLVEDDLKFLVDLIKDGIGWFKGLDDTVKENIIRIAAVAAVIGPVLIVLGTLISLVGTAVTGLSAFGSVALSLIGPIGLIGAALLGLVAILSGSEFKLNLDFGGLVEKAQEAAAGVLAAIKDISNAFASLKIPDLLNESGILTAAQNLGETLIKGIIDKLKVGLKFVQDFAKGFAGAFIPFIQDKGPQIQRIFGNVKEILDDINKFIQDVGSSLAKAFGIDAAGTGVGEFFGMLAGIAFEAILNGIEQITQTLSNLTTVLGTFKDSINLDEFLNNFVRGFEKLKATFTFDTTVLDPIKSFFQTLMEINLERFQNTITHIKEVFAGFVEGIRPFIEQIGPKFITLWESIRAVGERMGPLFAALERLQIAIQELSVAIFGQQDWNQFGVFLGQLAGISLDMLIGGINLLAQGVSIFIDALILGIDFLTRFVQSIKNIGPNIEASVNMMLPALSRFAWDVRNIFGQIQNVLGDVQWAFAMLEWKIGNVVNMAKWYLDQLGSKVQDVLRMITGSPELKLQHPFELFEDYLKGVDYGKLIESSMSVSMLSQLSTVPAASTNQGNTTNINKGVTANISGVPMDTASSIVNVLNRQVRMSEAFQ